MKDIVVKREVADRLLYDIIDTVNDMQLTAYIGCLAVRIGWFWVKFKDLEVGVKRPRGGNPPYIPIAILCIVLILVMALIVAFGLKTFILVGSIIYIFIFVSMQISAHSPNEDSSDPRTKQDKRCL